MARFIENFLRCPKCDEGWTTKKETFLLSKASSETNPVVIKRVTTYHCEACQTLISTKIEEGDNLNV